MKGDSQQLSFLGGLLALGRFPSHVHWKHPQKLPLLLSVLFLPTKMIKVLDTYASGPFIVTIIAKATIMPFFSSE